MKTSAFRGSTLFGLLLLVILPLVVPLNMSTMASRGLTVCVKCRGEGRVCKPASRRVRLQYKRIKASSAAASSSPPPPPSRWEPCTECQSTGLMPGTPTPHSSLKVAVVGGGIGGLALGVALRHRGIACTVYERDATFSQRRQGYGLTMQQASKALKSFGIRNLPQGITSTKHVVHTTDGKVVGEWGVRKWKPNTADNNNNKSSSPKRQNIHIARQSLRQELLNALEIDEKDISTTQVKWGCQLQDYKEMENCVKLTFQKGTDTFTTEADLLVGADGIRSVVRSICIGEEKTQLRYLHVIVILGICQRAKIPSDSPLLDGETVFQTADGSTRLYAMPYSPTEYMWQLSFPLDEDDAKNLSRRGAEALKQEALRLCGEWHDPIPQILNATRTEFVSGYPVYDRDLLTADLLSSSRVTLLGDAAHPMSPFKGQGANQALLDSLSLARALYRMNNQKKALQVYKEEMLVRSAVKVKASAEAAQFLHSDIAIQKGNVTRAEAARREEAKQNSREE